MFGVVLEGGTLTSSAGCRLAAASTACPLCGGGWGTRWAQGWLVVGTLLGPEGADPPPGRCTCVCGPVGVVGFFCRGRPGLRTAQRCCLVPSGRGVRWWGLAGAGAGGGRLFVENCTVDASIFDCRPARAPAAGGT